MRIDLGAFGDPGHAFPMIALGSALAARGHEVALDTWRKWREPVEAAGKTWYSGAAVNVMPAASTGSRHLRHVSIATSWPRAASAPPSAIIGKAWPGSPKAPR